MAITPGGTKIQGRAIGCGTWPVATATSGTDTAAAATTLFYASIYVPGDCLAVGIQFLVGSVGGTDSCVVSLHDTSGTLIATSALAGTVVGTAAQKQQVPFTAPVLLEGTRHYLIGLTINGTTAKFRSIPAYCDTGTGILAGSTTVVALTPVSFVPSSTLFTADKGVVGAIY